MIIGSERIFIQFKKILKSKFNTFTIMRQGTITVYSASAGSGKTFSLTGVYLNHIFRSKNNFRRILAVTFTNKATSEMKGRILDHLYNLSAGNESEYLTDLMKTTGKNEAAIRKEAGEILFSILHDYSRFSISTIDAFFQKILRAFTREVGLNSGFLTEIDHDPVLSDAVDEMIASSANDKTLNSWLTSFLFANLENEKSWNLKFEIMKLSEELFNEKFKILSSTEREHLDDKDFLFMYIRTLRTIVVRFEEHLKNLGSRSEKIFSEYGLLDEMFFFMSKGVPTFVRSLVEGDTNGPNKYVREINGNPPRWSKGVTDPRLQAAIKGGLEETLKEAIKFYDENITDVKSAKAILSNIYTLGILSDVMRKIHQITSEENSLLLSDAGEIIYLITANDQTPFIYEKVGNQYEIYMIDEFQDTSHMQWKNFSILVENSMAQGFDNLVVGDIKQSIYRWRNSDWKILSDLNRMADNERIISKTLLRNWRSRLEIIRFNNYLFSVIPDLVDELLQTSASETSFRKLYNEAVQIDPGRKDGGYVRLEFVDDIKEEVPGNPDSKKRKTIREWQDIVLDKLPHLIESIQDKGYHASDIGIIIRDGKEGGAVLKSITGYSNKCLPEKRNRYNYNIISNDTLVLSNSPAILFIISVLKVLNNQEDCISKAAMRRFYLLAKEDINADTISFSREDVENFAQDILPAGCEDFLASAKDMLLFEATENIIRFFGLGQYSWNVAYLNTFQDWVLNLSGTKSIDLQSFLDWWEITGKTKTVILPADLDAIRINTIHKSKGLEFSVIILPFLSWNLDHKPSKQPILWLKPERAPFNQLGIVPVRYREDLSETVFRESYIKEKHSAYLDNLNLLYVAMTRARDAIYGFIPETPGPSNAIAKILKSALMNGKIPEKDINFNPMSFFNTDDNLFEMGKIPEKKSKKNENSTVVSKAYIVNHKPDSLKLKLHWENYLSTEGEAVKKKVNYGKLMHEVFAGIKTADEVPDAVTRLVLAGEISEEESGALVERINSLIKGSQVQDWFKNGNNVLTEAEILLPSGNIRRPDRVIIDNGRATVIDFKFGDKHTRHASQVKEYQGLLKKMGFRDVDGFLWYVDKNEVVTV